ncbi:hypothetical protein COO60DRAFT_1699777 [Scenedesmus sp. NREL 46B-D3]|nr:hypothetical protein COO60DRAFT_1699777 [Scenedesmus sp. NREL 46B-D3]
MAWAQCAAIAGDETGRLYGVARSDVHPGTFAVWVADVYPDALKTTDAQEAAVLLNDVPVAQVVQTVPAIDFDVTAAAASADGHQLLLVGATRQEDAAPVLALVDIYGSQPAAGAAAGGSSSARNGIASSSNSSHPAAKQRVASLYYVHQGLYSERPSMKILKAAWHPSSPNHFAALASDNRWRLYHSSRLSEAEQTFALRLPGNRQAVGLRRGALGASTSSSSALPPRLASFVFGPPSSGWASLSVLFLASNGGVYLLCPVAPFGMRVAASVLQRLLDGSSDSTAHTWLLAAFLSVLTHESEAVSARPHMLETAAPALQGPLNRGSKSLKQRAVRSVACTLALSSSTGGGGLSSLTLNPYSGSQGSGFAVVATGFSNGSVYAHALELGQVLPVWLDGVPQCAYDKKGEVAAVRYEAEAVPAAPAAAGLAPVAEESQQSGTDSAAAAAAGAAAGGLVSPLLLLDVLKINLHSSAAAGASDWEVGDEADSAGGNWTDSEEESDAGYDPSTARGGFGGGSSSSRQRSGRAASSSRGGGGLGVGGSGFGSDDDDAAEDLEDQQLLQLTKVTLHAAPELPGRFWACHDQGCWGINIRWLQQLAARLDDAAGAAASAPGFGQLQLHLQLQQQQQQQQLAAPVLQELLVSGSAVAGSCVVGNALLGSGCVVLESPRQYQQQAEPGFGAAAAAGGGVGCLTFLRPRPAGVLGDGVLGGVGEGEAAGEEEGLGLGLLALSPEEVDAKSRMEDFYADICRGPRRLPAPQRPPNLAQLTPSDPAGLKHLNDVASWLLRTHVEFANGAHADLSERARQLHDEAHEQTAAIAALRELAAAAGQRQEAIAGRLARLGAVADTLAERSSLLAGLHWSLPRPASMAEQQMEKQLEVWEQRRNQVKASWRALQARLEAYTASSSAAAAQQASAATPSRTTGSGIGFGTPIGSMYSGAAAAGGYASPLLQQTPASGAAGRSPFLGVPALASSRARDRCQVTQPPQGLVNPAKLQQLKEMLAGQNVVIAAAREKLTGLFDEVENYRLEHPEVELPGRLRSSRVVV